MGSSTLFLSVLRLLISEQHLCWLMQKRTALLQIARSRLQITRGNPTFIRPRLRNNCSLIFHTANSMLSKRWTIHWSSSWKKQRDRTTRSWRHYERRSPASSHSLKQISEAWALHFRHVIIHDELTSLMNSIGREHCQSAETNHLAAWITQQCAFAGNSIGESLVLKSDCQCFAV